MPFKKEIEQSLEQIQSLSERFCQVRDQEVLPLSFFSSSLDTLRNLTACLHGMESAQFKLMEAQLIKHKSLIAEEGRMYERPVPSVQTEQTLEEKIPVDLKPATAEAAGLFLEETIKKQIFSDLNKALSLNDRFRFQRELFRGDAAIMDRVLDHLNAVSTLDESIAYLTDQFSWNWEDEAASDFNELLGKHFLK